MPEETQDLQETTEEPTEETTEEAAEETTEETTEETSEETTEEKSGETEQKDGKTEEVSAVPEPKTYKVKVDGEELDLSLNEEQVKQHIQKALGADKRFMDAAKERERVQSIFESLKKDYIGTGKKLGINVREEAEKYLTDILMREQMPEEQRKLLDAQDEINKLKQEKESLTKVEQEKQIEVEKTKWVEQYTQDITSGLDNSQLPKTPNTVARVASYLHQGIESGIEVPIDKAIKLVEEDYKIEMENLFQNLSPEQAEKLYGTEFVKKVKQLDLSKITSPEDKNRVSQAVPAKGTRKSKKISWDEFTDELDKTWGAI